MPPVLIIPGWMNSGPDHWQSLWEAAHPAWQRVHQQDWDSPTVADWVARLDEAIRVSRTPPVLVAPADVEQADTPIPLLPFAPIPLQALPFPTVVVASRDDPYATFDRAELLARSWGADLVDAGRAGHLNSAVGFGPWPAGEAILSALIARAA